MIFGPKIFWSNKFLVLKTFRSKKNFWSLKKKNFSQKVFDWVGGINFLALDTPTYQISGLRGSGWC